MTETDATVLVVDDDESTRFVFTSWLRRAGFGVREAATGAEALRLVEEQVCDLVVLDVNLPDMTGYDVCERIKSQESTNAIPVLYVSATAVEPTDRLIGLDRGADGYLVEPLEREELLGAVGALLRYAGARRRAEALAHRLGRLHAATLEMSAAGEVRDIAEAAASAAADLSGGWVAAVVRTSDGGLLVVVGSQAQPTLLTLTSDEMVLLAGTSMGTLRSLLPDLGFDRGPRAFMAGGRLRYTSSVIVVELSPDDESLESVLRQLSHAAAIASENLLLLAREHATALTLQRSLLPRVPSVPWLDIAARYVASTAQVEVGGDFYDVLVLDDDRVALVIGDVQGHSLWAATVMATLRNSLAAYLIEGRSPAEALELLNRVLMHLHPDVIATVCCIVLDRSGGAVVANAGHLPPLAITEGGVRLLQDRDPLLGLAAGRHETEYLLGLGAGLVLFTDGLVERRDASLDSGLSGAVSTVNDGSLDAEDICDRLIGLVGPGANAQDDIAILAVRLRQTP